MRKAKNNNLGTLQEPSDHMSIGDARANFSEVVGRARHGGLVTIITCRGKPVAAVVPLIPAATHKPPRTTE